MSYVYTYKRSSKTCAVCNFWGGERTIDAFGQKLTVASPDTPGRCSCQASPHNGEEVKAEAACKNWKPWAAMKRFW